VVSAPRAIWAWTAPPPAGRLRQVWVDADGHPLEFEVDVSDLVPPQDMADGSGRGEIEFSAVQVELPRTSTPPMDEVTLAALLARCR
jgi:hypothetical protein